ncbi:hypothetical protein HHI36_006448, partial [Cryptolaemus montrouzieri]
VDGDTDTPAVQEDFKNVIRDLVAYIKNNQVPQPQENHSQHHLNGNAIPVQNGFVPNGHASHATEVEDLEREPLETISQRVGNGIHKAVPNGISNGHVSNGVANGVANGMHHMTNGHMANGREAKKMVKNVANGGLPSYTSLANDRLIHNEVTYMDTHI